MSTDYTELVGEYFESRYGYHSSTSPNGFIDKGTVVEVLEVLPDDRLLIRYELLGKMVVLPIEEFEDYYERI